MESIYFEITNACNLHCMHCYNNSGEESYAISEELFNVFLNNVKQLKPNSVCFSGGEPFMHKNIFEFIDRIFQYVPKVHIVTNGVLLANDDIMLKLRQREVYLQFSIDGLEQTHDLIRGYNTYRKAIYALKNAIKYIGPEHIVVKAVVTKYLVDELDDYVLSLVSCGIKNISFGFLSMTGRAKQGSFSNMVPMVSDLIKFHKKVESIKHLYPHINIHNLNISLNCGLLNETPIHNNIKIDVFGNVYFCQGFGEKKYSIGTLTADKSISDILISDQAQILLNTLRIRNENIASCKKCLLRSKHYCSGGCVADGINLNPDSPVCDQLCNFRMYEFFERVIK